ncbi:MAG: hypothetical protein IT381_04250 [Deltaproteobacteria bacterium]|nr:hypothetical protein [Deltaproteobacteria bacterium]
MTPRSDRSFLLAFAAVAGFAVLAVAMRACERREIVAARQAYTERFHAPPPEDATGCTSCHLAFVDRAQHPPVSHVEPFACVRCHRGDDRALSFAGALHGGRWASRDDGIVAGAAVRAQCMECHTRSARLAGAEAISAGEHAFEARGCIGCHASPLVPGAVRVAPPFAGLGRKLSRELVYRYLLDPSALDAHAGAGTHHLGRELSTDRTQAKAMALAVALLVMPPKPVEVPKPVAASGRDGKALLEGCSTCHGREGETVHACDLAAIGTKTNATWLRAMLHEPARYTGFRLHPSVVASEGEIERLAEALAAQRHPTFEGRWPTVTRALEEATDAMLGENGLAALRAEPLHTRQRALGVALLGRERCVGCHDTTSAEVPITRADVVEAKLVRGHFTSGLGAAERDAIAHFIDASLVATRSREVPVPARNGGFYWARLGCGECHDARALSVLTGPTFARALARSPHNYGLRESGDAEVLSALAAHVAESGAPSAALEPVASTLTVERGAAACKRVGCAACFVARVPSRYTTQALRHMALACAAKNKVKVSAVEIDEMAAFLAEPR